MKSKLDQDRDYLQAIVEALEQLDETMAQVIAVLPEKNRELFLRLMVALGLREDDPILPILLSLHLYSDYIRVLLGEIKAILTCLPSAASPVPPPANQPRKKPSIKYDAIQLQIDQAAKGIRNSIEQVDGIRQELQQAKTAFLETSLRDVLRLGVIWTVTGSVLCLVVSNGLMFLWATERAERNTLEEVYHAFGEQTSYNFARALMNRGDNAQRFIKCQADNNDKCTVWLRMPPQNTQ